MYITPLEYFTQAVDVSFKTGYSYLHKKIHNICGHLFNENFNDSQNFPFSSCERGRVYILLRLGIRSQSSVSVDLWRHSVL